MKQAIRALEARVKALEDAKPKVEMVTQVMPAMYEPPKLSQEQPKTEKRGLCPKCNKAPNHFFHVRTCKG
jgi:hypothetical protein